MIEALLFDCDGVLADSEPLNHRCWSLACEQVLGAPLPGPAWRLVGLDLDRIVEQGLAAAGRGGEPVSPEARSAVLARKSELFWARAPAELRPTPGALGLVARARARKLPTAVVSAALRERLVRTLAMLGLAEGWGCVLSGEDLLPGPRPEKDWRRAALQLSAPLSRCAVLDDSPEAIASARRQGAGLVVGVATSLPADELRLAGAHLVVGDLEGVGLDEVCEGAR